MLKNKRMKYNERERENSHLQIDRQHPQFQHDPSKYVLTSAIVTIFILYDQV